MNPVIEVAYYRVDGALVLDVVAPVGSRVRVFVNGHLAEVTAQEPDPEQRTAAGETSTRRPLQ